MHFAYHEERAVSHVAADYDEQMEPLTIGGTEFALGEIVSAEQVEDWVSEGVLAPPAEGRAYLELGDFHYLLPLRSGEELEHFVVTDRLAAR